jgi:CubicO group peptidase (beta-lactamase class C family)
MNKTFSRFFLSFLLLVSIFTVSMPQIGYAQQVGAQTQAVSNLSSALSAIEQKVEARRKELGIPGMSLAIVKDGEIIYAKGFGYKDFSKQVAVTPDTQFAIGSATKAFTALSILMSQEEGKLSLDDSPKKYLPYFKINNADIDSKITIRDLLSHASGLNRTDLAMITGKLTREELIRVAGEAMPTFGLREKFQYQNIMFAAAGEIVAKVQKEPWEKFVPEKIFKPLGMTNSTMTVGQMQKAKDYSFGYDYNFDTKETLLLPTREIAAASPAGAINSSANDMAKWLKFMLAGGEVGGKRLVSESLFAELTKPQMKITPDGKVSYGLGWFIQDWKGLKVVQHGGNIDGFNSMVAMIPEKKLGFVMLTNVSGSSLGGELMPIVWENILGENKTDESVKLPLKAMEKLVGKYRLQAAGFDIEIKIENENLLIVVPGQPTYTLQRTGERQFKIVGAPEGYAVKFTPAQGDATEMYLIQPQGNFTLPRVKADGTIETKQDVSADTTTPKSTVKADDIMTKTIAALGGEANWRKITTREMKFDIDFVHQGVKGYGVSYQKTPNLAVTDATFTALGKPIATDYSYFDGTNGGEVLSFSPAETFTGKRLEDIKLENDFYGVLNWKAGLQSAEVKTKTEKVGDEEVYVVVFHMEKASDYTLFISTKTFLPLKRTSVVVSSTSSVKLPVTQLFSDYRAVDGIMLPFKTVSKSPAMGDVVTIVKEVKHNVEIADSIFKPKK